MAMLFVGKDSSKILFKNDFLEVKLVADNQLLTAEWTGVLDSNRGHKGCEQMLKCVKENPVRKILNNNSKVPGHSGASEWLGRVWLPALSEAGVEYFAWVYSPDFFTQLGIDNAIALYKEMEIKTFFSVQEALDWLDQY
ncbi:hypothetical protein [Pontibacter sp. HJ8]